MEEWKEYKLGDYMDVKGGKRLPKGANLTTTPNTHPYIRVRDLGNVRRLELNSSYEYVDDETQKTISRYIVNEGDIIISIVGTIGLIAIIGKSLNCANLTENCVKLVNIKGFDKSFLYYYLTSFYGKQEIEKGIVGAVQAKLPIKNIQNISIKAPSLNTQQKIANILSSLDDKIEVNRRINEQLEELAQALFKSWFVDFEPFKDGEFVESELGMIPEGWKVVELSELLYIAKESINPSKMPDEIFYHYSIPAYDNNKKEEAQLGKTILSNKFKVSDKMTLFSKLNPRIKRVWFLDEVKNNAICSTEFVPYKAIDDDLVYFVDRLINSDSYYNKVLSIVNGATGSHQRFHPKDTLKFTIAYNEEVSKQYSKTVEPFLKKILVNQQEITHLTNLRDTLLPKLMSGEIDVEQFNVIE